MTQALWKDYTRIKGSLIFDSPSITWRVTVSGRAYDGAQVNLPAWYMSARSIMSVLMRWLSRCSVTWTPLPGPVWPNQSKAWPSKYQKTAAACCPTPRSTTHVNLTWLLWRTWTSLLLGLSIRAFASERKTKEGEDEIVMVTTPLDLLIFDDRLDFPDEILFYKIYSFRRSWYWSLDAIEL